MFPEWFVDHLTTVLQARPPHGERKTKSLLRHLGLRTICEQARCPNLGSCFAQGVATFLILGEVCTRGCRFCAVPRGTPAPVDEDEPFRLLQAVRELGLTHAVFTSVTRDDLADGGAAHFARVIQTVRRGCRNITIEVLTPDFGGHLPALELVAAASPEIWAHNLETVPRLYRRVRPGADFYRSLHLLARIKKLAPEITTKSGLMLGLGETPNEIQQVLQSLRRAGVELVTLGQYLAPSGAHLPVARYVPPAEYDHWARVGRELGFIGVAAGPLVRSSYHAGELYQAARKSSRWKPQISV